MAEAAALQQQLQAAEAALKAKLGEEAERARELEEVGRKRSSFQSSWQQLSPAAPLASPLPLPQPQLKARLLNAVAEEAGMRTRLDALQRQKVCCVQAAVASRAGLVPAHHLQASSTQ